MQNTNTPIIFVVPSDLHLTERGLDSHRAALWMVEDVNRIIRPDFVQFIGDNAQNAREQEFQIFREICDRLEVPFQVLVGDHDVHEDPQALKFRKFFGDTYGVSSLRGFRFVRLNTLEFRPLGLSNEQTRWFRKQVDGGLAMNERVVVFQHHYPYKVWEDFDGPGIDAWREVVQTRRIAAVFTGHTHYGQMANDGRNIAVATRSIGDPEGGPSGYTLAFLHGDDLAVTYRSADDHAPLVLITHPREKLLATGHAHIVSGSNHIRVRAWSPGALTLVQGRIDDKDWFDLRRLSPGEWEHPLAGNSLSKGEHLLEVQAIDSAGMRGNQRIGFMVDLTGRYTATPMVRPVVTETAFC